LRTGSAVVVDVVVVEIAGQLGGVLVLDQALEFAPGRVTQLLAALLGGVQIFRETIEVHLAGGLEGGFLFVLVELF
jgi:hypothetical protein